MEIIINREIMKYFFSKNNLLFYGLVPEFTPEVPSALKMRISDLFRFNLGITRQIQLQKVKIRFTHIFMISFRKSETFFLDTRKSC